MFILYAVVAGLLMGLLAGGRLEGIASIRLRWAPLALAGLAGQVVLFSDPVASVVADAGPPLYVVSSMVVLACVLRNLPALPALALVALGAGSNLAAILANGGFMPTTDEALAALGRAPADGYSNSRLVDCPALAPLTDNFALPGWLPFANVFSIGDVLIATGIALAIALAMRQGASGAAPDRAVPVSFGNSPE